jgi:hypothetical protein
MISYNNHAHDLSNTFESIMGALEAIEIKLQNKDIKGALETLSLIKDKKIETDIVLEKIKRILEKEEV